MEPSARGLLNALDKVRREERRGEREEVEGDEEELVEGAEDKQDDLFSISIEAVGG